MDAIECIMTRRSSARLVEPAPAAGDLDALLKAAAAELERTRGKPLRAPLIVAVISSPKPSPKVPRWEQVASAAAATQNLFLAANALGCGCMWRTGWYGDAPEVRDHLSLSDDESVMAWVYLGTEPEGTRPPPRPDTDPTPLTTLLDD